MKQVGYPAFQKSFMDFWTWTEIQKNFWYD